MNCTLNLVNLTSIKYYPNSLWLLNIIPTKLRKFHVDVFHIDIFHVDVIHTDVLRIDVFHVDVFHVDVFHVDVFHEDVGNISSRISGISNYEK